MEFKRKGIRHARDGGGGNNEGGGNMSFEKKEAVSTKASDASSSSNKDQSNQSEDPIFLIQQISTLQENRRRKNKTGGKEGSVGSSKSTTITHARVALANAGQFKAVFQTKTLEELMSMGIVVDYDHSEVTKHYVSNENKRGDSSTKKIVQGKKVSTDLRIKYLFSGDEANQDMFTVTGTAGDQHMVESFLLSLEHLLHMNRTLTIVYRISNTTFYVSELVHFLQGMHRSEKVLSFGR